jgi:hypothetical protein
MVYAVSLNGQTSNNIDAVNSNGKYAIASSTTNPDLTINNINFSDDANYVCFATNIVGTRDSGNARVDVKKIGDDWVGVTITDSNPEKYSRHNYCI